MYFDRYDICEAYAALEMDWHKGGILQERTSCRRRNRGYGESVGWQLKRIGYRTAGGTVKYADLSENGRAIYDAFVARHYQSNAA